MYKMPEFTENDQQAVIDFIYQHPFIVLTGCHNNIPVATQVPVLIHEQDGKIVLRGHIMRKTDHHLAFEANPQVLVLFTGPQCYVSASWYSQRNIGSTWNYMTVHGRGTMQYKNEAHCLQLLTDLTHKYEDPQQKPELLEYMSMEGYVKPMMKAIVSFEIVLESITPIFKLSQNRDDKSHARIVEELKNRGDYNSMEIAKEMLKRRGE
jgi:transcriptional regulator